jgi:dolichol-phosphate mannosyltransferase
VKYEINTEVKSALIFPSYREFESLSTLLDSIIPHIYFMDAVIICDDTGLEFQHRISSEITELFRNSSSTLILSFSETKGGRGAAVFRGMKQATQLFPNLEYVLEADSDGSHRPEDIIRILRSVDSDFIIGSRYLPESEIIGWPVSRKFFSSLLNWLIPKVLNLSCTDATNGLRRYSNSCVKELLSRGINNPGFIYLSEQAVILKRAGYSICEVPISFVNRTHGESSVGIREIYNSILGLLFIWRKLKKAP